MMTVRATAWLDWDADKTARGNEWGDVERAGCLLLDAIKLDVMTAKPSYRHKVSMNRLITDGGEKVYLGSRPDLWIPQGTSESLERRRNGRESSAALSGAKWNLGTRSPSISHCLGSVLVCC